VTFILRTYVIDATGEPIQLAATRYSQCLAARHAIPRFARCTVPFAHFVIELHQGKPTGWYDEYFVRVPFDDAGHATRDDVFQDLTAQLHASAAIPPNRWQRGTPLPIRTPGAVLCNTWRPTAEMRLALLACLFGDYVATGWGTTAATRPQLLAGVSRGLRPLASRPRAAYPTRS
jgi:hypothetical protein